MKPFDNFILSFSAYILVNYTIHRFLKDRMRRFCLTILDLIVSYGDVETGMYINCLRVALEVSRLNSLRRAIDIILFCGKCVMVKLQSSLLS